MDERTFWNDYELIRAEVSTAIDIFYTYVETHNCAVDDKAILMKLKRHPSYWNICLYGLQTSFFIVLSRIFDNGPDALSIHKVVGSCIAHPEFFSKKALAARRCAGGEKPDYLDDLLARAFEPTIQDLKQIKKALRSHRQKFDAVYRDIRHNVFAHNILKDREAVADLFGKTLIKDIDDMLYSLYDLLQAIWDLYQNGRRPELGVQNYNYRMRIRETTRAVLSSLG